MDLAAPGRSLAPGEAEGPLRSAERGLSFWGGVDPQTGTVIDQHHRLRGQCLAGCVLAIPGGRGSCSGSGVLLELILAGHAPAAIVVCEREQILTLGALLGQLLFDRTLPVLQVDPAVVAGLDEFRHARVSGGCLHLFHEPPADGWTPSPTPQPGAGESALWLDATDRAILAGEQGKAAQFAMRVLLRMAMLQDAPRLIDVSQVHIDSCIYTGPACLQFAELLVGWQARVRVPTTLNAISVDKRRWQAQGVSEAVAAPASALADAFLAMGAQPTFTCAPYLLEDVPGFGEQIGWAESNAVVYANSVLGARTMKYPDYLDVCIALTGRAPLAGSHLDAGRQATLALEVELPEGADDAFWPLLGYCCGSACGDEIPLIVGLEGASAGPDELKAFSAAFATTAAAPMFHIAGLTPEAEGQQPRRRRRIGMDDILGAWASLNSASSPEVGLISLGNPLFSLSECTRLSGLVRGRRKSAQVAVVVTCGRTVYEAAASAGDIEAMEAFGVQFVTDTCWCMLGEPVIPPAVRTLMTNSAKYAHYAPGLVGRNVRFGSLAACVEAACSGKAAANAPQWML